MAYERELETALEAARQAGAASFSMPTRNSRRYPRRRHRHQHRGGSASAGNDPEHLAKIFPSDSLCAEEANTDAGRRARGDRGCGSSIRSTAHAVSP